MNCVICLDDGILYKYTTCPCVDVYFHRECWTEFRLYSNRCPMCRNIITDERVNMCPIIVLILNFILFISYNVLFLKSKNWNDDNYYLFYLFCVLFLTMEIIFSHIDYVERKINFLAKYILYSHNKIAIWCMIIYYLLYISYSIVILICIIIEIKFDIYFLISLFVFIYSTCQRMFLFNVN